MSNKTIVAPANDVREAPEVVRLNDRGEEPYEGTREYMCRSRACFEYMDPHVLTWGESIWHTAFIRNADTWEVEVSWAPDTEAWAVYAECANQRGPITLHDVDQFHEAVKKAAYFADNLNAIDEAGDIDIASWAKRAVDATRYESAPYNHLVRSLGWLVNRPELALETFADMFSAVDDLLAEK